MKFHLPFGIRINQEYSSTISKEEYHELMLYARENGVKLENFKRFAGDTSLIKELIDDIVIVAYDFPKLLNQRKSVVIRLEDGISEEDFATTDRHLISINAKIFCDREYLEKEYALLSKIGKFVRGTTYRSIIRHELGHVVANVYKIDPLEVGKHVMPDKNDAEIIKYIKKNLSLYAADYVDGREFISECFSAYYSNIDNPFVKEYVKRCKEIVKEGENDKK